MRKGKIIQVLIGFLLVAALVLIPMACKAPEEAPPAAPPAAPPEEVAPPPVKDTIIIGVPASPTGLDPDITSGEEECIILGNIYEPCVRWPIVPSTAPGGAGVGVPDFEGAEGCLWESWEISPDKRTVTAHLRKGVLSPYGNEMTAKDALWTYQRWFALEAVGAFFFEVANITDPNNIKVLDDYTISLTSDRPNPMIAGVHFVGLHTGYHDSTEVKKHATADDPWAVDWCTTHNASFGPYYITEWSPGDRIVLEANPNYYLGEPAIKKIIRKVIPESSSRVATLKAGTIDVATQLTPKETESLQGVPGVRVVDIPGNNTFMLFMNQKFPPWDNKLVRQAVSYAIPREEIIETALYGYAGLMNAIVPSMYPAATPKEEYPYYYDPDKARELLADAGYPDGFECELTYNPVYPPDEVAATLIKTNLAEIGIDVALRKIPWGTFFTEIYALEIPFGFQLMMPFHHDPFYGITLLWITGGYDNVWSYSNPEVDRLTTEGLEIVEWEQRKESSRVIQRIVMDDAPVVCLLERNYTIAMRDNIEGWNWNTWQGCSISEVSFK